MKIGPAIRQRSACEVAQLARALRPITVRIQPEFQHLLVSADRVCAERFGARLVAVYLAGSVALCEAWPGASDLDCFAFLDGIPSPADKAWRRRAEKRLETEFPVASEVHLNVYPTERLRQESFWRFILRYNSLRINGSNLVAELGHQGFRTPRPSRRLARSRLSFVRQCLSEALAGRCPPALAGLPDDPFLASRKLARNFVVVEGAFILMCQGRFSSFEQGVVLAGLLDVEPRWRPLLRKTETILTDPHRARVRPDDLMVEVEPFMNWGIAVIEGARK